MEGEEPPPMKSSELMGEIHFLAGELCVCVYVRTVEALSKQRKGVQIHVSRLNQ